MLEGGSDYFLRDGANRVFDRVIVGGISALVKTFREFVEELGKALIDFGKKLIGAFETALQEVKTAVEKVVDVIASIVEWIKEAIISLVREAIDSLFDSIKDRIEDIGKQFFDIVANETGTSATQSGTRGLLENHISQNGWIKCTDKQIYYACVILPLIFSIGTAVFALTTAMGLVVLEALTGIIGSLKDFMLGRTIAIGLIYGLIGVSLYFTIKGDMGYVVEAFAGGGV